MNPQATAIDTEHLDHQTMGDRELRLEILQLYRQQARLSLCRLDAASSSQELYEIAHTLKGASLGVGAKHVVEAARELEEKIRAIQETGSSEPVDRGPFVHAVEAALDEIDALVKAF